MTQPDNLSSRLLAAHRPAVLEFIAAAIHGLTIRSRCYYSEPDRFERMREANEAIHRLAGHMRGLVQVAEPLTETRIQGIIANAQLLSTIELDRLQERYLPQ